jgi:hypothetical protein
MARFPGAFGIEIELKLERDGRLESRVASVEIAD